MPDDKKPDNTNPEMKAFMDEVRGTLTKLTNDVQNGLAGQRSMYDRRFNEVRQQLQRLGGSADAYDRPYNRAANDGGANTQDDEADRLMAETDRYEAARDRFERRTPQYTSNPEIRKRVDTILADQSRRADLLSRDDHGRISYDKVFRTAYLEARDQIATEAEAHAATARAQADEQNRSAKATAALSGDVAEELPEGLTLDDIMDDSFTPEMMIEKGLVQGVKKRTPVVGV